MVERISGTGSGEWKSERVMDDDSGKSKEEDDVTDTRRGPS